MAMAETSPPQAPQGSRSPSPQQVTVLHPLVPDRYRGAAFEDIEDWLDKYERVAQINQWTEQQKLSHVYFALDDSGRTWYENREAILTTWNDFRQKITDTFASADRRDRAQQLMELRVQQPNESVTMFAEDMARLFRRADPNMTEDRKLRYLMRGVKEQLFAGLVRNPPVTVADFIREATAIERALHQRCRQYDRLSTSTTINAAALTPEYQSSLRELIREIVREEVHRILTPTQDRPMASIAEVVRDEIRQAFPAAGLQDHQRPMSYAAAVKCPAPVTTTPPYHQPPTANPWSPPQAEALRRAPVIPMQSYRQPSFAAPWSTPQNDPTRRPQFRRSDAWRTVDNRPLCFNCGGAGHISRHCWHRDTSFRPLRPWSDGRRANDDSMLRRDDANFQGHPITHPNDESVPNDRTDFGRRSRSPTPPRQMPAGRTFTDLQGRRSPSPRRGN